MHAAASSRSLQLPTPAGKVFVPGEMLGGQKPEARAADSMHRLTTYVAVAIVRAQLEGLGNDGGFAPQATMADGSAGSPDHAILLWALENVELGDGDDFLLAVCEKSPALALRLMEVRSTYAGEFDWQLMQELTRERAAKGNKAVMKKHLQASGSFGETGEGGGGSVTA